MRSKSEFEASNGENVSLELSVVAFLFQFDKFCCLLRLISFYCSSMFDFNFSRTQQSFVILRPWKSFFRSISAPFSSSVMIGYGILFFGVIGAVLSVQTVTSRATFRFNDDKNPIDLRSIARTSNSALASFSAFLDLYHLQVLLYQSAWGDS